LKVWNLVNQFGCRLRVVGTPGRSLVNWLVESMRKDNVEWTKRFLRSFIHQTDFDSLVKIDPDTTIHGGVFPLPEKSCDVAGDFRKCWFGWVWCGGYHFFTRKAAETLLNDPDYAGKSPTQDIPLTRAVIRNKLTAWNMEEVNGYARPGDPPSLIVHAGSLDIPRRPAGFVNFLED
jgi:hypothetical protein